MSYTIDLKAFCGLEVSVNIAQTSLRRLRTAIQNHEVSFPAQIPIFSCQSRSDIQWRLVDLYFVRNWTCAQLGERYGVTMERARQLISQWVQRAIVLGYVQEIPVGAPLEALAAMEETALEIPAPVMNPAVLSQPMVHAVAAPNGR
jgi:hypothetical protein